MKKTAIALIVLATTVGVAQADQKNIDHREHSNKAEKFIEAADLNGDRAVTMEEHKAFLTKKREDHFSKLDANGDGSISKEEFLGAAGDERASRSFERFDVNKDGKIDLTDKAEAKQKFKKHLNEKAPPQPGDLEADGKPPAE